MRSTPPKKASPKANKPAPAPAAAQGQAGGDPFKFWDEHFATAKKESPITLFQLVSQLIQSKKFNDAEAAIKGFLKYHGKEAEPWMYVWLAECITARQGSEKELKQALGFAGYLAKRTKNPNDLVRVADVLVLRNFYEPVGDPGYETNIGELVDLAAEKVPANAVPPMMSINLASKKEDPKRMGDAAERLLALGWPGIDDQIRSDVKQQVKGLAETLRAAGRSEEAEALMTRLAESEARDVFVKLTWKGEADIDLAVAEPLGATAKYANPRTVFGGAIIKNGYGNHPEEVYVCPRGFDGDYAITVEKIVDYDAEKPVKEATLEVILHEGSPDEKRESHKIDLTKPSPVVVRLEKGRRKNVLPILLPADRRPVAERPKGKPDAAPVPTDRKPSPLK